MGSYYWNQGSIKLNDNYQRFKYGSDTVRTVIYGNKPVYYVKYGSTEVYAWNHPLLYWAATSGSSYATSYSSTGYLNDSYVSYYGSNTISLYLYIINYSRNVLYLRWLNRSNNNSSDASINTAWSSRTDTQSNFSRYSYTVYPRSYNAHSTYYGGSNGYTRDGWSAWCAGGDTTWWRSSSAVIWPVGDIDVIRSGYTLSTTSASYNGTPNSEPFGQYLADRGITPPGLVILDFRYKDMSDGNE